MPSVLAGKTYTPREERAAVIEEALRKNGSLKRLVLDNDRGDHEITDEMAALAVSEPVDAEYDGGGL